MREVWKFKLPIRDIAKAAIPKGARILHVGNQYEELCLWCLVSPKQQEMELRQFCIAGTGHPIVDNEESLNFIGTVLFQQGTLVFHVFEITDD